MELLEPFDQTEATCALCRGVPAVRDVVVERSHEKPYTIHTGALSVSQSHGHGHDSLYTLASTLQYGIYIPLSLRTRVSDRARRSGALD